ncbi:MAG: hypothetical protein ACR2IE_00595 [Candidatus Sumerlaeaceae bacterium]
MYDLIVYGCFLCALIAGLLLYRHRPLLKIQDRIFLSLLPLGTLILLGQLAEAALLGSLLDWNASRLYPTFLLRAGLSIYAAPGTGPILSTIYGPLTWIAYLPATFAELPFCLYVGSGLSVLFFFTPAFLAIYRDAVHHGDRLLAAALCYIFFMAAKVNPALATSAFWIHADAPALGFTGMAAVFLYLGRGSPSHSHLAASACCAVLAVWTKQTVVPVIIALPLIAYFQTGLRAFRFYLVYLVAAGILVSGALIAWFGWRTLFYNMLVIPGGHPFRKESLGITLPFFRSESVFESIRTLARSFIELVHRSYFICSLFLLVLAFKLGERVRIQPLTLFVRQHPWCLFLLVGLMMIPTAVLNRAKIGGSVNAYCLVLYFLSLSVVLMLGWTATDPDEPPLLKRAIKGATYSYVFASLMWFLPPAATSLLDLRTYHDSPQATAYEYARKHPGEIYFPWNPLSTYLAEGKAYHFFYGIIDRELAGQRISQEHLWAHLPAKMRYLAYLDSPKSPNLYFDRYLPAFFHKKKLGALPGWIVLERDDTTSHSLPTFTLFDQREEPF